MESEEAITIQTTTVCCDGGGGALGHPSVYLKIGAAGDVVCPYCSRHYVLEEGAAAPQDH